MLLFFRTSMNLGPKFDVLNIHWWCLNQPRSAPVNALSLFIPTSLLISTDHSLPLPSPLSMIHAPPIWGPKKNSELVSLLISTLFFKTFYLSKPSQMHSTGRTLTSCTLMMPVAWKYNSQTVYWNLFATKPKHSKRSWVSAYVLLRFNV